ncbi:MAG: hypothetical protein PHW56_04790, partial [Methanosarcinaceae archaeon]|nr:hypothetical protein [Methanosarcinaceae archaeon]
SDKFSDKFSDKSSGNIKSSVSPRPARPHLSDLMKNEKAFLEPQTDLLAVGLAVIGFVVFAAILSRTYLAYEEHSFALENYESATLLAENLAGNRAFLAKGSGDNGVGAGVKKSEERGEGSGLFSAAALDELASPSGQKAREKLFSGFSGNYVFFVEVRTENGKWEWKIEPEVPAAQKAWFFSTTGFPDSGDRVAASVPVAIELSPAETVRGTLTVYLYDTGWV